MSTLTPFIFHWMILKVHGEVGRSHNDNFNFNFSFEQLVAQEITISNQVI